MKKWLPLIWIILSALVIIAGAFLPEYILTSADEPELNLDYKIVTVSTQDSTDYYWRLLRYAECASPFASRGTDMTQASMDTRYSDEALEEMQEQAVEEAEALSEYGVLPSSIMTSLRAGEKNFNVTYYFDSVTMRGFQIGSLFAIDEVRGVSVYLDMDLSGGKIFSFNVAGVSKRQIANAYESFSSWAELLRTYADYLGLKTETEIEVQEDTEEEDQTFYEMYTVQALTYAISGQSDELTLHIVETDNLFYVVP